MILLAPQWHGHDVARRGQQGLEEEASQDIKRFRCRYRDPEASPSFIGMYANLGVDLRWLTDVKQPSMGPPVALKPQVGAESAFDQMSKRNKEALKDQTIQDAVDRKLRIDQEKDNRTDKNGRRAARQVAPQLRSTALSKKRKSENPLAQPKDECERTPDWQRSFSTGPPKTTTSKPTIAQVQEGSNETMVSGKAGSIDRKRKAEEGLEGKEAKIAKGNKGPFSESRSTSPKRANVPAQNLTAHETIFGKGSKPRVRPVNLGL